MMISLTERQKDISNFLLSAKTPIGVEEISRRFDISRRSVYYDLAMIEKWTEVSDLKLVRDSRKGIAIIKTESKEGISTYNTYLSPENRQKFILLNLFLNDGYSSAQEISQTLSVSRNTIINDIKAIRENPNIEDFIIEGVRSHGYYISGDETKLRSYFVKLIISFVSTYDLVSLVIKEESVNPGIIIQYLISKVDFKKIKKCVKNASEKNEFWLPDMDYIRFIIYQALSVERIKIGCSIEEDFTFSKKIKSAEEFLIAKSVCSSLGEAFDIEINDPEIINTSKMLLTCNIKTNDKRNKNSGSNSLLQKTVDEMIKTIVPITSFDKKAYQKLNRDILDHLKLTIKQIQFGIVGKNPLLDKIRLYYGQSYQLAERMAEIFSEYMDIELPESEIGFIALHVAVYLETTLEKIEHPRAIVICNSGKGSANILSKRLNTCVPELIVKGNYSILQIEENESLLEDVDLIISTINYANRTKPVLIISPFLSGIEISLIKNFINHEEIPETNQILEGHNEFFSSLYDRLSEKLDPDVMKSIKQELQAVDAFLNENFIHKSRYVEDGGTGGEITALIVCSVMNIIDEYSVPESLLVKEETTGLLIHMIMAIDRWKKGEFCEEPDLEIYQKNYPEKYQIALKILTESISILRIQIPESEAISILRYLV